MRRSGRRQAPVPPSRIIRRSALRWEDRRERRTLWFGWGAGLSRAERERAQARLATVVLSAVLALVVALVGGTLLWNKVILAQQPVVRVDGHTFTLRQYTDFYSYRQNVLLATEAQLQQLANQPPAAGTDSSSGTSVQQLAQQQLAQVDDELSSLSTQLIEDLIDGQLIRQEAAQRGIVATPPEIEDQLKQLIGYQDPNATPTPAPSATAAAGSAEAPAAAGQAAEPAATATSAPTATVSAARSRRADTFQSRYRDYLRATGGTDAVVRYEVETQILRTKLNNQLAAAIPDHQEQVHARHILVPDETAAKAVLDRLKNGESFEALAAELSTDTGTKDKGGDLGWFPRGIMVPEFEDAAFKLQPGQVSDPIKTDYGYHIIRVDERDPDRPLDPDQLDTLKRSALTRLLEEDKKTHKIERLFDSSKLSWALANLRKPVASSR
jgi:parvulin-like peptidyl-prolyl isomerase